MNDQTRSSLFAIYLQNAGVLYDAMLAIAREQQGAPPPILEHFTSVDAAVQIVRSSVLQGTHCAYLNDASEVAYGSRLSVSVITGILRGEVLSTGQRNVLRMARKMLQSKDPDDVSPELSSPDVARARVDAFAVSFSVPAKKRSAKLFHWLSYGRSGTGCIVKFHSTGFVPPQDMMLLRVIYSRGAQRALLRNGIMAFIGKFEAIMYECSCFESHLVEQVRRETSLMLVRTIRGIAAIMKDQAFTMESEWRLLRVVGTGPVHTAHKSAGVIFDENRPGLVVPRLAWPFRSHALHSIELGYAVGQSTADALRFLMARDHGPLVPITRSDVPVR